MSPAATQPRPTRSALAFDAIGGPLVAVCGLAGGAGATTLAYLLAAAAARDSLAPILAADIGGPTAAMSLYANAAAPRSLVAAANRLSHGAALSGGLFAPAAHGLRVVACEPDVTDHARDDALRRILGDGRLAHGLTVLDCGTASRSAERVALQSASHVLWVIPATRAAARRAAGTLRIVGRNAPARETIVARHAGGAERVQLQDLDVIAEDRRAEIVLLPQIPDLAEQPVDAAIAAAEITLNALGRTLGR